MNQRNIGIILIIVGLVLAALSLTADLIGLGEGSGLGYKQIAGLVFGVAGIIAGVVFIVRKSGS